MRLFARGSESLWMQEKQTVKLEHKSDLLIKAGPPWVLKNREEISSFSSHSAYINNSTSSHVVLFSYIEIIFQILITCVIRGPNSEVFVAGYYFPLIIIIIIVAVCQKVTKFCFRVISVAKCNNPNYVMDLCCLATKL